MTSQSSSSASASPPPGQRHARIPSDASAGAHPTGSLQNRSRSAAPSPSVTSRASDPTFWTRANQPKSPPSKGTKS
jgi:hypothetical protein